MHSDTLFTRLMNNNLLLIKTWWYDDIMLRTWIQKPLHVWTQFLGVFLFTILTLIILSMHEHRVLMTYLSLSMIDVTVYVHVTNKTQIINHDQMIYIHNIMNKSAMNTGLVMWYPSDATKYKISSSLHNNNLPLKAWFDYLMS